MALTTLAHTRRTAIPAANNITSILDSIFDMLNASATWTPVKELAGPDTVAVYAVPVAAEVSDMRIVFAGVEAGAPTPTMKSPDTFSVQTLMIGISRGVAGAFVAWDNANPFADGEFSGYSKAIGNFGVNSADELDLYESAETIWLTRRSTSGINGLCIGALFSSDDTDPANSEDSEGRVYGMVHGDPDLAAWANLQGSATSGSSFGAANGSNSSNHAYAFEPSGSFVAIWRMGISTGTTAAGQLTDRAGNPKLMPDYFYWSGSAIQSMVGRFREVYGVTNSLHSQQVLDAVAAPLAEILAISTLGLGSSLGLLV